MNLVLILVSAFCALIYGVRYCHHGESLLRSAVKTGAVVALAMIAVIKAAPVLLILALALSALGDLALSRQGDRAFLIGLGSFALAHVFYILLFVGFGSGWPMLIPAVILVFYAISTECWLAPHTGDMRWPVRVYVVLISGMGLAALTLPRDLFLALIGAGAFLISDTLLAVQLFRLEANSPWQLTISRGLWLLYYLAQLLILWAFLA